MMKNAFKSAVFGLSAMAMSFGAAAASMDITPEPAPAPVNQLAFEAPEQSGGGSLLSDFCSVADHALIPNVPAPAAPNVAQTIDLSNIHLAGMSLSGMKGLDVSNQASQSMQMTAEISGQLGVHLSAQPNMAYHNQAALLNNGAQCRMAA